MVEPRGRFGVQPSGNVGIYFNLMSDITFAIVSIRGGHVAGQVNAPWMKSSRSWIDLAAVIEKQKGWTAQNGALLQRRLFRSVAIKEVKLEDWLEKVYEPDIRANWAELYKKPGYGPSDLE